MFPILLKIGPITIYSLGVLLGLSFFLFIFLSWRRLREIGLNEEKILDMLIIGTIIGIIISWFIFRLQHFPYRGISFWGGISGAIFTVFIFSRKEKWSFWAIADELAYALCPFGVIFNLGLFLDGSGAGIPTALPWGMFFPGNLFKSHPVSLYNAIFFFFIWLFVLKIERDWRGWGWLKDKKSGFVFLSFLLASVSVNFGVLLLSLNDIYWFWLKVGSSSLILFVCLMLIFLRTGIWPRKSSSRVLKKLSLKNKTA